MARRVELQKRHFEFLALTLRDLKFKLSGANHALVVAHMASALSATNCGFKYDKFTEWALDLPKPVPTRKKREPKFKGPVIATDPYWE